MLTFERLLTAVTDPVGEPRFVLATDKIFQTCQTDPQFESFYTRRTLGVPQDYSVSAKASATQRRFCLFSWLVTHSLSIAVLSRKRR